MNAMEHALFDALMEVMGKVWHDLDDAKTDESQADAE